MDGRSKVRERSEGLDDDGLFKIASGLMLACRTQTFVVKARGGEHDATQKPATRSFDVNTRPDNPTRPRDQTGMTDEGPGRLELSGVQSGRAQNCLV